MTSTASTGAIGRIAKAVACAVLAYWGIYALVAPVTNIDSQMYDLARVELAARGGLFGNGLFTSAFQVMWPWGFDAVHLPFLEWGWGYALPSFLCLVGTCSVVLALVRARFGPDAGWVGVLALLSLACVVYQGTSTKNDIPVLFAGAVWVYARWRRRREANDGHLTWMVLAVGFMAGAKTTGAFYAAILSLWTLWELRASRRLALRTAGGLVCALFLFGSVETYVETARLFGHPLGPQKIVRQLRNRDGMRGAAANLTRYVAGSVYVGPTTVGPGLAEPTWPAKAEKAMLARTGLTDAGTDPRFHDRTLVFFQSGFEELSGFGPVGTIAMATMLFACLCWRPRAVWWRLAVAAFLGLAVTSATVAYSEWGNRYLIGWYALGSTAAVCALWEIEAPWRRAGRWVFAIAAAAGAVAAPLLSFNRGPAAIVASIRDRDRFETCAVPLIGNVRERLRTLREKTPASRVYFVVGDDSPVLPILEDPKLDAILVTPPEFLRLAADGKLEAGDLVVEDYRVDVPGLAKVDEVSAPDIFLNGRTQTRDIYRVEKPPAPIGPKAP